MGFNLTVLNSCSLLSVNASSYTGAATAELTIEDMSGSGGTYGPQTLTYTAGSIHVNIPIANLTAQYGVFKACLSEGGVIQACRPVIIHCDIDCCLVKLTNELIDCHCDCPRCATALAKAQKIFLLLQAANSAKELALWSTYPGSTSAGYYQDMVDKYLKARQICDDSCGCNC